MAPRVSLRLLCPVAIEPYAEEETKKGALFVKVHFPRSGVLSLLTALVSVSVVLVNDSMVLGPRVFSDTGRILKRVRTMPRSWQSGISGVVAKHCCGMDLGPCRQHLVIVSLCCVH